MAYCRFSKTCDVYMYSHVLGGYQFHVASSRVHPDGNDFRIEDPVEALRRLRRLQTQGFGVPDYAIERLDIEINSED